jgi:hypothetical protein
VDGRVEVDRFREASRGERGERQGELPSRSVDLKRNNLDRAHSGHDACYGLQEMLNLAQQYNKSIVEESTLSAEEFKIRHVGKQDPKRHLGDAVEKAMGQQVVQGLGMGVLSEVSVSTVSGRGMAVDGS